MCTLVPDASVPTRLSGPSNRLPCQLMRRCIRSAAFLLQTTSRPEETGRDDSLSKKSRRVRRRSGEKIKIIFCRGVYVAENTLRLANVGVVCQNQTTSALQQAAALCRKAPKGFFDSLNKSCLPGGSFFFCTLQERHPPSKGSLIRGGQRYSIGGVHLFPIRAWSLVSRFRRGTNSSSAITKLPPQWSRA